MRQVLSNDFRTDESGNPAGGVTHAIGLDIRWQDGPLVDPATGARLDPNGCFLETVVAAAIARLGHYQSGKFACRENAVALTHLETALLWLGKRTADRETRGVEGTHAA